MQRFEEIERVCPLSVCHINLETATTGTGEGGTEIQHSGTTLVVQR